jgi:hypothetical protein
MLGQINRNQVQNVFLRTDKTEGDKRLLLRMYQSGGMVALASGQGAQSQGAATRVCCDLRVITTATLGV